MSCTTAEFVAGLRELADWYERHPDLPNPGETKVLVSTVLEVDAKATLAEFARAFGKAAKVPEGPYFSVCRNFGPITLDVYTSRENVCQRVVVGTEQVPEHVIPAHENEIVEWVCDEPLLASVAKGEEATVR